MVAVAERESYTDPVLAKPPASKVGVCRGIERAPEGYRRFKVRADFPPHYGPRYFLAANAGDVRAEYLKVTGLEKLTRECDTLHKTWQEDVKTNPRLQEPLRVQLVVTPLSD